MASARFAWGIDVGNRALKAVKLVRENDVLRVDDFELIEHETVLSNAGDNRESLIQTALANFVQRHSLKGGVVSVGVSGQQSFARFIKLPPVEPKKIPEIVRFEAIQQIPFPLDDVEWAYQLFETPDSPDVEVGIFAIKKDLVNRHLGYFTDFDMNVTTVQMNPLAVYNAMYYDQKLDGTTMVIDLGAENTDLLIASNDTIWMRSIPIGGNNFTEALVKSFKLPFNKAEDLKRTSQTSKYARQIFQAMRPIFADLVAEIQRSIGFYSSVHRETRIKKIIALGGTFKLPGLTKYLQQNLQLDVEKLDSIGAGAPADPKLASAFQDNVSSVVSAYGLAIQAMGEGKVVSSLLPAHIRRERMWQEKTKWFGAAAALFVVGTGIGVGRYLIDNAQFQAAQSSRDQIAQIQSAAQQKDQKWDEVSQAGEPERARIRGYLQLDQYRGMWRDLLVDVQNSLPAPQPALLGANLDAIRAIPRGERNLFQIESIQTRYFHNLGPALTEKNFARWANESVAALQTGADGQPVDPSGSTDDKQPPLPVIGGDGSRGFLIVIRATSTRSDTPQLIEDQVLKALLANRPDARRPMMDYAISRAVLVEALPIKQNDLRKQKLRQEFDTQRRAREQAAASAAAAGARATPAQPPNANPGGMFSQPGQGTASGSGAAPREDEDQAFRDRLLGDETVLEDWEVKILIAVVLDPPRYDGGGGQQASARRE